MSDSILDKGASTLILEAARSNNLDLLKGLVAQSDNKIHCDILNEVIVLAVDHKNADMIYFAMALGASGGKGILHAASKGDMESIDRIEEHRQISVYADALALALRHGHYEVAKWAIRVNRPLDLAGALVAAASTSVETLKWLFHNVTSCTAEEWIEAISYATMVRSQYVEGAFAYMQTLVDMHRAFKQN